ncbi:four-carbon acid sugar kinase family protein [Qingshengfaniella alkalisoli]|nr:four-carbon acid sugar kinase family protein [Qingshengfaniella alkalisoli]
MALDTLILADDLTGALDSAVGFSGGGRSVIVARSPVAVPEALARAPNVLAINTSSREIRAEDAARRVGEALAHLDPAAVGRVLKKVDSRLKGNIMAEVEALERWFAPDRRVACPAIPGMGRRVTHGALEGSGVDQPIPVADCFVGRVEVPDVASDADLDEVVQGGTGRVLWIGARGLAFALARASGVAAPEVTRLQPSVMIANGSRDPVTRAQIATLGGRVTRLDAPDGIVPEGTAPHGRLVLSISDGGAGISGLEAAARFARGTAQLARQVKPAALLICGGESAQAVLDQFGLNSLQVSAELRPGLPVCEVQTDWGRVQVVTKSGGFGAPGLLAEILDETVMQR